MHLKTFPEYEYEDEDKAKNFTPKQVALRDEISNFGIKEIFEDNNQALQICMI